MANYADRFLEEYLLGMGSVVASIVAAIGHEHPEVRAAMETALGDLETVAHDFPKGSPLPEVRILRVRAGL